MSRTKKSLKNVKFTFIVYILNILLQFFGRTIFLRFLTVEYLGINGLFSNILSILNLTELGIGSAMVYALYKPCAENDINALKQIMFLYKRLYWLIGIIIFIIGGLLTPFLPFLINRMPSNLGNIYIFYWMFLVNTVISYFFTYKRSLIICYQKQYITTITNFIKNVIICFFQIIILFLTRNYYFYLVIQIIFTVIENYVISCIADREFPFLKEKTSYPPKDVLIDIQRNVLAMSFHKIGGAIVNGTDNLIIAKFVSLSATGLYSNYSIIISACTSLITQIFFSITASVGNLVVSEKLEKVYIVFKRIYFVNFIIYYISSIGLFVLINDFISLWLGNDYLLSNFVVFFIILSYFSNGMRRTVLMFKDAKGLFWNDRYKPLVESIFNLLLSIPLTIYFGIAGTFIGTVFTNIFVSGLVESYILFKRGFNMCLRKYLLLQCRYYFLFFWGILVCYTITNMINLNCPFKIFIDGFVIILIMFFNLFIIFYNSDELKYLTSLIKKRF